MGRVGLGGSDLLDAQMQRAEIAQARDEGCVLRQRKLQAEDADVAAVGEGKSDVADRPRARESGHIAIARRQQGRARKRRRRGAMAVEDGVDLLRRRHVRGGDGVVAKLRDPQRPRHLSVADRDGVDVVAGVALLRRGDRREVACEPFAVEASLKDLGVADGPVRAVGVVHAVQRKGGGVEVALRHDAGGVDEVLIVRAAGHRRAVEVGRRTQRLQVGVDDRVRLRQQPRGLWRSGLCAAPAQPPAQPSAPASAAASSVCAYASGTWPVRQGVSIVVAKPRDFCVFAVKHRPSSSLSSGCRRRVDG